MVATNVQPASSRRGPPAPRNPRPPPPRGTPRDGGSPSDPPGVEHRPLAADPAVDRPFAFPHRHDTPPADPEAARHVVLQRHLRRDASFARRRGDLLDHLPRTAGEDRYPRDRFRGGSPPPFQHRLGAAATERGGPVV